ncbi:MAG TPA: hypothetical protein VMB49_10285 [Acidobacteriaceae bacterium]|nr:hypothetical protein [Acidobacteriaceae bacterium]
MIATEKARPLRLCVVSLLFATVSFTSYRDLVAANCNNPVAAVPTSTWHTITPPQEDVEIVYFAPIGWVGLNHIYAIHQALVHRKRAFIPWMIPQIVTTFPYTHALEAPANRRPLFYVDHSDTAAHIADLSPHEIHLVHLRTKGKDRELYVTSGASVFRFEPGFPSHTELPLKVNALSNTVFTLQPEHQLEDGEYMIVLGPVAAAGFEFGINCSRDLQPGMPRIDAGSQSQR